MCSTLFVPVIIGFTRPFTTEFSGRLPPSHRHTPRRVTALFEPIYNSTWRARGGDWPCFNPCFSIALCRSTWMGHFNKTCPYTAWKRQVPRSYVCTTGTALQARVMHEAVGLAPTGGKFFFHPLYFPTQYNLYASM